MSENKLALWKEGNIKKKITDFVKNACDESSPGFIPPPERIAAFDNDGTLWAEYPMQMQIFFALDKLKDFINENPEKKDTQPFKAFIEKDLKTILSFPKRDIMTFLSVTHQGRTPEDFQKHVLDWFEEFVHPRFKSSAYNCTYKPQCELLDYLRENGFKTFIVSGSGLNFMRAVAERIYGIPPEQIIGTSGKTKVEYEGTKPVVTRLPELLSYDDREEKVNNIALRIGRVPVFVFGNSDGDLSMMRYAINSERKGIAFLLHHDDDEREAAYDRDFKLSPLKEALDVSEVEGINVVSMKNDWTQIF